MVVYPPLPPMPTLTTIVLGIGCILLMMLIFNKLSLSLASVRPRSVADDLICSAVDISHPCQQENTRAGSSAANGPVRCDIINGLGACEVGGGGNPLLSPG